MGLALDVSIDLDYGLASTGERADARTKDEQAHLDSKVYGTNVGPTWVLSAPGGLHVGSINLAIRALMPYVK